ncbi:hypothetical protein Q0812_10100 [Brevundimonas sp. 2R-24]|uniref:TspO/MBR related protein n=1 Tax=Peiella sedimenti TaxID=3061083 RepID=A0ABT8SQR6_9CAUL|nr:hypothetical protein [Caulobacteraceae bacterium XZ-24]
MRRILVLIAALIMLVLPVLDAIVRIGLTQAQFAEQGNETLRAAGYAFTIWSVIYVWIAAYAVYQVWPRTPETPLLRTLGWASVVGMTATGLWIPAAAFNWRWATVGLISLAALSIVGGLVSSNLAAAGRKERGLVLWPLGLLGGWLTIATALNLLTVMTAEGIITPDMQAGWALAGIGVVLLVGMAVTFRTELAAYPLPIVWGLVAVYVAMSADQEPTLAAAALIAAVVLAAFAGWVVWRSRREPRPA